jgi:hypothetical protein
MDPQGVGWKILTFPPILLSRLAYPSLLNTLYKKTEAIIIGFLIYL